MLKSIAVSLMMISLPVLAKTDLTVYTAFENEQLQPYKQAFEKEYPDINIKWVRDSTGVITAKLLAEKARPRADVIWGLAASSLAILDSEGMLEAYAPANLAKIGKEYRDHNTPPAWVGMDVWAATVCYNPVEGDKLKLTPPKSWQDLTKPEYKGKIVMPNPASSGTGYLDVSAWLQLFGEENGWKYMDALDKNIAQYVHSGSKPCKMVAAGEYPIGISFELPALQLKKQGAPVEMIFPEEGLGWEIEATAIMKGSKNIDAAKKLADFSASPAAMALYSEAYAVVAQTDFPKKDIGLPADYEQKMIKNDFGWAAKNRDAIIKEWRSRYDSKSARQ